MPTPTPTDLNSRIALAKGWTWHEESFFLAPDFGNVPELRTRWLAPIIKGERYAEPATRPNFVGTLKGVSGMLRELNKPCSIWDKTHRWLFYWDRLAKKFICQEELYVWGASPAFCIQRGRQFWSPDDHPGDCVGEAYIAYSGRRSMPAPLTDEWIEEQLKLCEAASQGPWRDGFDDGSGRIDDDRGADITLRELDSCDGLPQCVVEGGNCGGIPIGVLKQEDVDFIIAARAGYPKALERLVILQKAINDVAAFAEARRFVSYCDMLASALYTLRTDIDRGDKV